MAGRGPSGDHEIPGTPRGWEVNPDFALPGTRSVIVAGLGYLQPRPVPGSASGLVARYAWGRDYHKVLLRKLSRGSPNVGGRLSSRDVEKLHRYGPFGRTLVGRQSRSLLHRAQHSVDQSETRELVSPGRNSDDQGPSSDRISLPPAWKLSFRMPAVPGRLSYGSPGRPGKDRREEVHLLPDHRTPGGRSPINSKPLSALGCSAADLCQEVCPFNLAVKPTDEPEFLAWKAGPELNLEDILHVNASQFTARFGGSPVHRTGRNGLVRNACLVGRQPRTKRTPSPDCHAGRRCGSRGSRRRPMGRVTN